MVFVSFFSKNSPYEQIIESYLIPSLKKWNLSYDIDAFKDKGSWIKNVQHKPQFIKNMLLKHRCPIVSLDADAVIEKNPILFKKLKGIDYACHFYDWGLWYNKPGREEMLGGTQFFNYNNKILKLVDNWLEEQKKNTIWAQKVLEKLLKKDRKIKIYRLPIEYCFIKTDKHPEIRKNAVIFHNQLSRRWRNKKW